MSICDLLHCLRFLCGVPSIRHVLRRGYRKISCSDTKRISNYVHQAQRATGGFADRSGRADMYYTFFGILLADSLSIRYNKNSAIQYVRQYQVNEETSYADTISRAVLLYRLCGDKKALHSMLSSLDSTFTRHQPVEPVYADFMRCVAYALCRSYFRIPDVLTSHIEQPFQESTAPTPLVAARLVMTTMYFMMPRAFAKRDANRVQSVKRHAASCAAILMNRANLLGGITASAGVMVPDLLSTAVSLYALKWYGCDLRAVTPSMLEYITATYRGGTFASSEKEEKGDIEYLFYGLLALGSL